MIGNIVAGSLLGSGFGVFDATGGNEIVTVGSYKYHVFTSNGNFVVSSGSKSIDVMSCAGGAGGGYDVGAGGGAGELDLFTSFSASVNTYAIVVGSP